MKRTIRLAVMAVCLLPLTAAFAQVTEYAATLQVMSAVVELRRANTGDWLTVRGEGILGSGDAVRTRLQGRARIVLFADGTEIDLKPGTTFVIDSLQADDTDFILEGTLVTGQTLHRIRRVLDTASSYNIQTDTGSLAARGTEFAVRQRENDQLAFLSFESVIDVTYADGTVAVEAGFGGRVEPDGDLSEIVRAATFAELDAQLDGCTGALIPDDNRRLPVYTGPTTASDGVGAAIPADVTQLLGRDAARAWYRVPFAGGSGWIETARLRRVEVDAACAGLRVYPSEQREDVSAYTATDEDDFDYCTGDLQPPDDWQPLIVQPGTTLFELASRYFTEEATLAEVNCIADIRVLAQGQTVFVPPTP